MTQVNRCLDAAKACNVDEMCQRLRTEYVSFCIRRLARADTCNRSKCHKALRKFFDRVPPEYTHELLFCPCEDTACAERRRQTIVPACSYESKEKPNCLAPLDSCRENYVCRYVGVVGWVTWRDSTQPSLGFFNWGQPSAQSCVPSCRILIECTYLAISPRERCGAVSGEGQVGFREKALPYRVVGME